MNRLAQFMAAPNQTYLEDYNEFLSYVDGVQDYPLAKAATRLKAIVMPSLTQSDVFERTENEVEIHLTGNDFVYLVRLYQDPETDEYLEEALIPADQYSVSFVENLLDEQGNVALDDDGKIIKRFKLTWRVPPDPSTYPMPLDHTGPWPLQPVNWEYPLGTPQAYIPQQQLPVAQVPRDDKGREVPYNPVVLPGQLFRAYTTSLRNIAALEQAKLKTLELEGETKVVLDMSQVQPAPMPGPMIVYYQVPEGRVLNK